MNPADNLLDGLTAEELLTSQRWICGPSFVAEEESKWPVRQQLRGVTDEDPGVKKPRETMVYTTQTDECAAFLDTLIFKYIFVVPAEKEHCLVNEREVDATC